MSNETKAIDLKATLKRSFWAQTESGKDVAMHKGQTYDIDSCGNGGVYVVTPQGLVFVSYEFMRWHEAETWTEPSGLVMETVR